MLVVLSRPLHKKEQKMVDGRNWAILAEATTKFITVARQYHFCTEILQLIERRLYRESPFPIHHKKEEKNK